MWQPPAPTLRDVMVVVKRLREDIRGVKAEIQGDMQGLKAEIQGVKTDMQRLLQRSPRTWFSPPRRVHGSSARYLLPAPGGTFNVVRDMGPGVCGDGRTLRELG